MTLLPRILRKAKRIAAGVRERLAPRERHLLLSFESEELDLADRWRDVIPNAVAGAGLGEVTAAYVAGALTRDEAMKIVATLATLEHEASLASRIAILEGALAGIVARKPSCPIYSAAIGGRLPGDTPLDALFWSRVTAGASGRVDALEAAYLDGYDPIVSASRRVRSLRLAHGPAPARPVTINAETLDLSAPDVTRDPHPFYEALRATGTVHYLPRHDFYLVLGFDDVQSAFAQPRLFSSSPWTAIDAVLAGADPPQHTAIRRLISRHFSAAAIDALFASAEQHAARLVKRELEVVSDFAAPISNGIAAQVIGADEELAAAIRSVTETAPSFFELFAALDPLVERASLFQTLLRDGEGLLGEVEARSLVRLFWMASTMTTERAISQTILRLLRHDVDRDPERLMPFIDEVLRLHPAEHLVARRTIAETTLGGVTIPAGALVQLCVGAANRDPAYFDDPTALRLDRAQRNLSFGHGIHYCAGAPLARRVVHAALRTLLRELPGFRALQPLASVRHFRSMTTLAPLELWIGA